jgi:hypothetical protein
MSGSIRTLVAIDSDVDARTVEHAFPAGSAVQVAGVVEGLDRSWSVLEETSPDLSSSSSTAPRTASCTGRSRWERTTC